MSLRVLSEFQELCPKQTKATLDILEKELIDGGGPRDPIVVWKGKDIIIDGMTRYGFCRKHKLNFKTVEKEFADKEAVREWILTNQLGRRNLTEVQFKKLIAARAKLIESRIAAAREVEEKEAAKVAKEAAKKEGKDGKPAKVKPAKKKKGRPKSAAGEAAAVVAKAHGVSEKTVERAKAVGKALESIVPALRTKIESQEVPVSDDDIVALSKCDDALQQKIWRDVRTGGAKSFHDAIFADPEASTKRKPGAKPPKEKATKATAIPKMGQADDDKNPVPDALKPVFEARGEFLNLENAINEVAGRVEALLKSPAGRHLPKDMPADLKDIAKRVHTARPSKVVGEDWKPVGSA